MHLSMTRFLQNSNYPIGIADSGLRSICAYAHLDGCDLREPNKKRQRSVALHRSFESAHRDTHHLLRIRRILRSRFVWTAKSRSYEKSRDTHDAHPCEPIAETGIKR